MPEWGYSIQKTTLDKDKTAIASGRDLRVSNKKCREVCHTIKNMMLSQAKKYLEDVIAIKAPVPYWRHHKDVPHRHGMGGRFGYAAGGFPEKSARYIYDVLANAESNAEYKGLDPERLKVIHAATMTGRKARRYIERAHGRSTPYFKTLTHIEIVLEEVSQ